MCECVFVKERNIVKCYGHEHSINAVHFSINHFSEFGWCRLKSRLSTSQSPRRTSLSTKRRRSNPEATVQDTLCLWRCFMIPPIKITKSKESSTHWEQTLLFCLWMWTTHWMSHRNNPSIMYSLSTLHNTPRGTQSSASSKYTSETGCSELVSSGCSLNVCSQE